MERRQFLIGTSTAAVAGLAGCTGSGNGDGGGGTGDSDQLLDIQSSELDTNEDDLVVITGEAENVAGEEIVGATIVAEIYDEDGNSLVDEDETTPEAPLGEEGNIPAGETAAFEIGTTQQSTDDIAEYELSAGDATQTIDV